MALLMLSNSPTHPVIEVQQITKCYQTYRKPIHRLWQSFAGQRKLYDEFWALKGVDLTVYKGETVGIVGKNGSGKSTLLQIITGILQASGGECRTQGRISALLELGAGFNPEFTGMENARLNASIMGLTREEFHQKLPDIVEFCGLDEFLHRPVKTYSSGMFVRLAFAVAINMNPDILIVDEALAVGDVRFQRKCFRRLDELKEAGVSILFVTHSTDSVLQYCDRAIMLDEGELKLTGSPKEVVQAYLEMMFESDADVSEPKVIDAGDYDVDFDPTQDHCIAQASYNANEHRWGDGRAKICHYQLLQNGAHCNGLVQRGDRLSIRMSVLFEQGVSDLIYGITVKTNDGNAIYGTNSRLVGKLPTDQEAGELVQIEFELSLQLLAGDYFISLGVAQDHADKDNIAVDRRYDMIHLHVRETPDAFGIAALDGRLKLLSNDDEQ
ncbi:MAG: ABC transporter ATP-binding protein [Gammaproteobacteria bacterium]|nr:ABC transporter ATP-binding protein [Gammaproteobacteria bacterium]